MSSRVRGKENARALAAEMRAKQAREARRRRILLAVGAIGLVIVVVGGLVVAKLTSKDDGTTTAATPKAGTTALPAAVLKDVTSVSTATSDKVAAAEAASAPARINAPALTDGGKPKVLYVGAEYCPYCAAERWPMVVALSRFGTWTGLGGTESSAKDVFPSTQTLSFHGAKFTSDYLTFAGYETESNKQVGGQYAPLDTLPSADQKLFDTYNKPPYIQSAGGIPFIDIGGTYVTSGASFSPQLLAGKSRAQIAAALADPSSDIAKAIISNANVLTATICKATANLPANVCTSAGVQAGATVLTKSQKK
jgi:Domain of unknown function (DUF929)